MSDTPPSPAAIRVSELSGRKPHRFSLEPGEPEREALRQALSLLSLSKMRFSGTLSPAGKRDWLLKARLGATIEQPCTVTLQPVKTRIDTDVQRRFTSEFAEPDVEEAEMDADETLEPLGRWIDPEAVMAEALSLEIPQYPRLDGAEFGAARYAEDGVQPMTDEEARPFAGLAALRDQLKPDE